MILLDTDVCIELLRGNVKVIAHRKRSAEQTAISFMTVGELLYGAAKSSYPEKNQRLVEEFILTIMIIQSTMSIMQKFGSLKAELDRQGQLITDADLFIAATALTHCTTLVTGNTKHFQRIEALHTQNWIR